MRRTGTAGISRLARESRDVKRATGFLRHRISQLDSDVFVELDRIFAVGTYEELKALSRAEPDQIRFGFATDTKVLMFYTADVTLEDEGWRAL